jgi:uncharacterized protein YkwD
LVAYLRERGDHAEPDGALSATAAWVLRGAYAGESRLDARAVEATAQRYGYTGVVLGTMVGTLNNPDVVAIIEQTVAQVPVNRRVTRYGVRAAVGRNVAIVIGAVEVELAEFPRSVEPGDEVQLSGSVSPRYERASIFIRGPSGDVRELPQQGPAVQARLRLTAPGVHQVEVMGYGTAGPVVLMNVPISVGLPPADSITANIPVENVNLTTERAEATLLTLLNASRHQQGLGALAADEELRAIALGHSQDMAKHHFFGHVSPTTGILDDRVQRASVRVSKGGECVVLESTPEAAYLNLMQSPAHRAGMLDPDFTHVGIGVAFRQEESGHRALIATLVLGRRPPPQAARKTAAEIFQAIQDARTASKLSELHRDPALAAAAAAGIRVLNEASAGTRRDAFAAVNAEIARRVGASGRGTCAAVFEMLELRQLSQLPLLLEHDLASVGVAVLELADERGPSLAVALVLEAKAGKALRCG